MLLPFLFPFAAFENGAKWGGFAFSYRLYYMPEKRDATCEKLRAMKFKLDASEFKLDASEFFLDADLFFRHAEQNFCCGLRSHINIVCKKAFGIWFF